MAWYTNVTHELKPVQSGYQLALSYNLIHTTTSIRPSLADLSRTTRRFRKILLSWRQNLHREGFPEKIIYLLQHCYPHTNYRGSALQGDDARAVAILESLGKELGFGLGLALVECHLQGLADDEHNRYSSSDNESYASDLDYDFSDGPDPNDLDFLEIHEQSIKIRELVNLDGILLKKKLKLTEKDEDGAGAEFIPANLRGVVESGPHDQQEYQGYVRLFLIVIPFRDCSPPPPPFSIRVRAHWNGVCFTSHPLMLSCNASVIGYHRTVLVIWPKQHDEQILHGTHYTRFLLDTLAKTSSSQPTEAEQKILEYALGLPPKEPKMTSVVLRGVCKVACIWKSSELLCRAIEVCDGSEFVDKVGKKLYLKALLHLNPRSVLPW